MLVLLSQTLLPGKEEAEQTLVSSSETRGDLLRKCPTITPLKNVDTLSLQQWLL